MAKRDTVKLDCEKVIPLIRVNEWNNSAFSRKVGKYSSWFGEVLRGKNLPSPEEASRICVLLQTTPEEILTEQADIELVRGLLEQEREKKHKKAPGHEAGGVSDKDLLIEAIQKIGDSDTALAVLDALNKRMQELR